MPAWALDPIYLEPTAEGVYGIQAWELFTEGWDRRFAARHYLCAVLVELEGVPTDQGCSACAHRWAVETRLLESDCAPEIAEDPRFLALGAVGLAEALPEVAGKVPHEEDAYGAWARYGQDGWTVYGWAYPEALDHGQTPASATWDGEEPFQLWPAFVWDLRD